MPLTTTAPSTTSGSMSTLSILAELAQKAKAQAQMAPQPPAQAFPDNLNLSARRNSFSGAILSAANFPNFRPPLPSFNNAADLIQAKVR